MEEARARQLLDEERAQVESLLRTMVSAGLEDQDPSREVGDQADFAETLSAGAVDEAIVDSLHGRLAAIERAEQRLADGQFGLSIRSGAPIPDARLEVMPTAELTVEEEESQR